MAINSIENQIRELALEQAREALTTKQPEGATGAPATGSFEDVLGQLVDDVDSLQKTASETIQEFATDESDASTGVGKKMQDADAAYNLMMQIRHKLVDVYSAVEKRDDQA